MKLIILFLTILINLNLFAQTNLVSYNLDYCIKEATYIIPDFFATPLTTTAEIAFGCEDGCATGCGLNNNCNENTSFITKGWVGTSLITSKFYKFTVTTNPNVSFYLNQFSFSYRRSNTGPSMVSIYINDINKAILNISGTNCINLGIGINDEYNESATIKIYFWGGSSDGTIRIDNLNLTHTYTTLPIELLYFRGRTTNNGVNLEWMTGSEVNNSHFDIEQSGDNISFNKIGVVKSTNGDTQNATNYNFTDVGYKYGTYYYRLKQIDYDGKFTYSNTIPITIFGVNYRIDGNILINERNEIIEIYDISGKLIKILTIGVIELKNGIYFIKSGEAIIEKIIINHHVF